MAELEEEKENENVAEEKALSDLAREKLKKDIAELQSGKEKEVAKAVKLAKTLAIAEFKASEAYGNASTLEASRYSLISLERNSKRTSLSCRM